MGDVVKTSPIPTYTELFSKAFPSYLAMGMSYDLFYNGDCSLVLAYREAHNINMRRDNEKLWLQGYYFYEALLAVAPVLNAFAKKGTRAYPYIAEPVPLTLEEKAKRQEDIDNEKYEKMRAKMFAKVKKKEIDGG